MQRLRRARWAALRRAGSRRKRTFRRSLISPANGSTAFMVAVHREVSCVDMDSSVSPTHGEQENSVWNGHYDCTCYHPLFVFNLFGDLERCALRPGNVHSADRWDACPQAGRRRGIKARSRASISGPTPASPIPMSTSSSKPKGSSTPFACRRTASCRSVSAICSRNAPLVALPMTCADRMQVSPITPEAGRSRAASLPRS